MAITHCEVVKFRLFVMPCCGHHLCWVNPRLPTYCPECGEACYFRLKENPEILVQNEQAQLKY